MKCFMKTRGAYEAPEAETIRLVQMMSVCDSNGTTENYGEQDPYEIPDND